MQRKLTLYLKASVTVEEDEWASKLIAKNLRKFALEPNVVNGTIPKGLERFGVTILDINDYYSDQMGESQ